MTHDSSFYKKISMNDVTIILVTPVYVAMTYKFAKIQKGLDANTILEKNIGKHKSSKHLYSIGSYCTVTCWLGLMGTYILLQRCRARLVNELVPLCCWFNPQDTVSLVHYWNLVLC